MPSSSAASVVSAASSTSAYGSAHKPAVCITLNDHYSNKVYQPGHTISGTATITAPKDTHFDLIEILLLCTSRTRIESTQLPQRSSQVLLKMNMPIAASALPHPRVLDAGHVYSFPFHFILPTHLTISACTHKVHTDCVRAEHTTLPPSLGCGARDDMAPHTAAIEYLIKTRVLREAPAAASMPTGSPARIIKLFEACVPFNVMPAAHERPPLPVADQDVMYVMSKTKTLRKGLLGGKLGKLRVHAAQPAPALLGPDGHGVTTREHAGSVTVNMDFSPATAAAEPPKITAIAGKIVATTFYAGQAMSKAPNMGGRNPIETQFRSAYHSSTNVFSSELSDAAVAWRRAPVGLVRRDSGYASATASGHESGSDSATGKTPAVVHTARLTVPFDLPTARRLFVPTFYSCLVARVYTLKVQLTLASGSHVTLDLPLQIMAEPSSVPGVMAADGLPSFEEAIMSDEEREVDELLTPRTMLMSSVEQLSNLPGYDGMSRAGVTVRAY